jgi:hypothetical protein
MRLTRLSFLAIIVLFLASLATQAQTANFHVLLRTMKTNIPTKQSTKSCVIVQDNGQYRYEELPSFQKATPQNSKVYTGVLPADLRKQLDTLVDKKDLIDLGTVKPSHWAMRARNDMELVSLRLRRGGAAEQELNYFVADGKGVIPASVQAFTPWMNSLKHKLGAPLKDAQPDTCKVANDTTAGH